MARASNHIRFHLTRDKLEDLLRNVGVKIVAETEHDLLGYCPFHHNVDSPAFNISKNTPYLWKCWNGSCNQKGNIYSLLMKKGYSKNEIKKILMEGEVEPNEFLEFLESLLEEEGEEVNIWEKEDPDRFAKEDREHGDVARKYASSRGIWDEAFDYFKMGYSYKRNMLIIPAFNECGDMAGVIGRSIEGKQYRYSAGLQRGSLVWNLNNAMKVPNDEIILTEGSLDAVYVWQAGFRNVGAILGSAISPVQWRLIRKHFGSITCFFDNDDPGMNLRDSIIESTRGLVVSTVEYPITPISYMDQGVEKLRQKKDPGELTEEEIRKMVQDRRMGLEFLLENV